MKKVRYNVYIIRELISNGNLKQLAVFTKLKMIYGNSCIYKYSYRTIHRKSGISINVLKQCIRFFIERGWCGIHSGNLIFKSIRNLENRKSKRFIDICVSKKDTFRDLVKKMRLSVINACYNGFEYAKQKMLDYNDPKNLKSYKSAIKFVKNVMTKVVDEKAQFSISNFKMSKMLLVSKSTASRLIKWSEERRLVKVKINYVSIHHYKGEYDKLNYSSKTNSFFKQCPNTLTF